jgi:hypothetical protein
MSNNKEHYHNKGEQDKAEDKGYNPPHGIIDELTTWSDSGMEKTIKENKAYREGWLNTEKQIKQDK